MAGEETMRKSLHLAVLFCVVLILFSGCSKTQSMAEAPKNIRISNLKTAVSDLSQEEREYMEDVCGILENASYTNHSKYDGIVNGLNNSTRTLNFTVYMCGYSKDGQLTERYSTKFNGLIPGQKFTWNQSAQADQLVLIGLYGYQGIMYMTDPVPLESASSQEDTGIVVRYDGALPTVVRLDSSWGDPISYSVLDLSILVDRSSVYQDVTLLVRKESGKDNTGDSLSYRLLDRDGHVHTSGDTYVYLSRGDTARVIFRVPIYEPGEYYLELY